MADETASTSGHATDLDTGRTTAPMSDFTRRAVAVGLVVFAIGAALTFVLPALATL